MKTEPFIVLANPTADQVREAKQKLEEYKLNQTIMTLQQAKDEVAKKHGYSSWNAFVCNEIQNYATTTFWGFIDEAAELYAKSKWDECFDATIYKAQQRFTGMTETQLRLSCIPKPEFKP